MMPIRTRRAEREDAYELFALARQYTTGRAPIGKDDFLVALDNVLRYRDQETNVLFVAVSDEQVPLRSLEGTHHRGEDNLDIIRDKVVGYTLLTVSRLLHAAGLTAHIQEIVVDEAYRAAGVGELLMKSNERYCNVRGVQQISASTARIGSFFNHLGYEPMGEHYRKILIAG